MRHTKRRKPGGGPMGMRCVPHQKEAFKTRTQAVNALARYALRSSGEDYPKRVYRDRACGFYHLTKNL